MKRLDVEPSHLLFPAPAFVSPDVVLVAHEIRDGRFSPKREIDAKKFAGAQPGKRKGGFAQGLTRECARVDTGTANFAEFFDERDTLAKDPRGVRAGNARRTAADDNEIEGVVRHRFSECGHEEH